MADSHIEALLWPEESGFRWNATIFGGAAGVGTAVNISYSFMMSAPSYAGPDGVGFLGFTEAQKTATAGIMALYSEIANVSLDEAADAGNVHIRLGNNDQTGRGTSGYAYAPSTFLVQQPQGGDVWI